MRLVEQVHELRALLDAARGQGKTVGFVPTMGFLHEGHRSLIRAAREANDVVVVSIFVNPLQFGPEEDLDRYPRDPDGDAAACEAEGTDLLFVPTAEEMFSGRRRTAVKVAELSDTMCGVQRPIHFEGVATIVTKLFAIVGPCRAYFGRKDYQQLAVIRELVRDLSLPVEVVGCPLVREPDGLAMSSRNAYLSEADRAAAAVLFRALRTGVRAVEDGERDPAVVRRIVTDAVSTEPDIHLEYVEVVSADDLGALDVLDGEVLVALAARVGPGRLIDNAIMRIEGSAVDADLGVLSGAPVPVPAPARA